MCLAQTHPKVQEQKILDNHSNNSNQKYTLPFSTSISFLPSLFPLFLPFSLPHTHMHTHALRLRSRNARREAAVALSWSVHDRQTLHFSRPLLSSLQESLMFL